MVHSRGGIHGGLTIADALREFEARGYEGQFVIRPQGTIECQTCGRAMRAKEVPLEAARRIEGASDPADMALVGALTCPHCGQRGTAVVPYGPMVAAEYVEVLRELDDRRHSSALNASANDLSLVRDTGWLVGPDDR